MNADIFNALELLEKEGIPQAYMIEKIEQALTSAFKKEYGPTALMRVDLDTNKKKVKAYLQKELDANGYDLTIIGDTIIAPLSLYSNKVDSVDALKELAGLK